MKYQIILLLALAAGLQFFASAAVPDISLVYGLPMALIALRRPSWVAPALGPLLVCVIHSAVDQARGMPPATVWKEFFPQLGLCLALSYSCAWMLRRLAGSSGFSGMQPLEWSPDPMFVYDAAGKILDVNQAAARYLQYSREELLGMRVEDFAHLESGRASPASGDSLAALRESLSPGSTRVLHAAHRRKDGSIVPVEVHLACSEAAQGKIFTAAVRDRSARLEEISDIKAVHEKQLLEFRRAPGVLQRIMDSSDNLIYAKDLAGRYIFCSLPTARFFGFDHINGVLGKRDVDLVPAAQAEVFEASDRKVLADPDKVLSMEEVIHGDEGMQCFLTTIGAFRNEEGAVAGTFGISRDISTLRRTELDLRQSEERLSFALEASSTGVWEWDLKTGNSFYSPICLSMLGYPQADPRDNPGDLRGLIHPDDRTAFENSVRRHLAGETPQHSSEHRLRAADGSWRWILSRGKILQGDPGGSPRKMFGTHEDITGAKVLTADLLNKNKRLELAARAGKFGIWELNCLTDHLSWDARMFDLFGVHPEDFRHCSRDWVDCIHPEDLEKTTRQWNRHLASNAGFDVEFRIVRPGTGEIRQIRANTIVTRAADGTPIQAVGLNWDVTEERHASDQLRQAKEAAEAGQRARSDFMALISHELRTPMNGVLGMADILLNTPLNKAQLEMVMVLRRSGRTLLDIINDILDFSSLEAGQMRIIPVPFRLEEILRETCDLLEPLCWKKNLDLLCRLDSGLEAPLFGDAGRLKQITTNLISNAIKFTSQGQITVSVHKLEEDKTSLRFRLEVEDTGIGIPLSHHETLFDPFQQVDQTTQRRHGGSGLGLSVSNQIAEVMGGKIEFASTEGIGSRFWLDLTLPLADGEQSAAEGAAGPDEDEEPPPRFSWRQLRLLLAEDNEANQQVATLTLEEFGHRVVVVENGAEALECLKTENFDLVLMDCRMPVMDGFEATRRIREGEASASSREVPIVALTASGMPGDQERCLGMGMNGFLLKPLHRPELARAFQSCGLELKNPLQASGGRTPVLSIPMLDPRRVEPLQSMKGPDGRDVLSICVELLLKETPPALEGAEKDLRNGDFSPAADAVHKVAGSCANLGATALHASLKKVELLARGGQADEALAALALAEEEWRPLRDALSAYLARTTQAQQEQQQQNSTAGEWTATVLPGAAAALVER